MSSILLLLLSFGLSFSAVASQAIADIPGDAAKQATLIEAPSASTISEQNTPMKTVAVANTTAEADIPVILDAKVASTDSKPLGQKILLVFSILGVLILTTWMLGRKFLKKGTVLTQSHQIKILSQASLGPKKSLAVIRVAGESVLIGITDTQVTMIKSLSLLDEDFPEQTPVRFDTTLRQSELASGPTEQDSFSFSSLKAQVTGKLQSMKVID